MSVLWLIIFVPLNRVLLTLNSFVSISFDLVAIKRRRSHAHTHTPTNLAFMRLAERLGCGFDNNNIKRNSNKNKRENIINKCVAVFASN